MNSGDEISHLKIIRYCPLLKKGKFCVAVKETMHGFVTVLCVYATITGVTNIAYEYSLSDSLVVYVTQQLWSSIQQTNAVV